MVERNRIGKLSALERVAKEYESRRRQEMVDAGLDTSKNQAPPLVLALLDCLLYTSPSPRD